MNWRSKRIVAAMVAAVVLGAGAGSAVAAGGKGVARGGVLKAAAQYLGITRAQLAQNLRAGQTLAQIAQAQGKSVAGLESALLAAVKARLDARVAAGRLSAERAQRLLARAPQRIERLVNRTRS